MGAREDAIDQANYFRDAAQDCVVEIAPDAFVVTVLTVQADMLRAHLTRQVGPDLVEVSLGDSLSVHVLAGEDEVVRRVLDSLRDEIRAAKIEVLKAAAEVEALKAAPAAKRAPQKRAAV